MPRTAGFTEGATPPSYVTRAYGFDIGWQKQAVCRGHNKPGSPFQHAWTSEPADKLLVDGQRITGAQLIEIALTFCQMCPVQWDCTTWALDVEERTGTWGIPYEDLVWLRTQRHPYQLIETARARGEAVQVAVTRRRRRIKPVRV